MRKGRLREAGSVSQSHTVSGGSKPWALLSLPAMLMSVTTTLDSTWDGLQDTEDTSQTQEEESAVCKDKWATRRQWGDVDGWRGQPGSFWIGPALSSGQSRDSAFYMVITQTCPCGGGWQRMHCHPTDTPGPPTLIRRSCQDPLGSPGNAMLGPTAAHSQVAAFPPQLVHSFMPSFL